MGHYQREDIPFQFALAEAFTICDAHHCSVTAGTDPNRIVFWSGSNFDPEHHLRGENCTANYSEVNNLRCWLKGGALPEPGYVYQGSAFTWPTVRELLERAGVSWKIYQDPNDNWTGLMHGGLAFKCFRDAKPGVVVYEKGMSNNSLAELARDVKSGRLPQVSWILPPMLWSEHPSPSSSLQGAEFTSCVLQALAANPEVWGKTVFFLSFDENDGLFDHVPPPAPPSYNPDGTLAGKATLDLRGEYFLDPDRKYLHPEDRISGTLRPWGLGPRVPMYVISPWSRGGWVNSQAFDHTSVGQFLERRFGITVPAINPWHTAVCGDLTSCFDFGTGHRDDFLDMRRVVDSEAVIAAVSGRPRPSPPAVAEELFQEPGVRHSRALPYELHVDARMAVKTQTLRLEFRNTGRAGAVFHVYDRLHLDRIPRRYTVEAGKGLDDTWTLNADSGLYDLWVYGPNGFVRKFRGVARPGAAAPTIILSYQPTTVSLVITLINTGSRRAQLELGANAYHDDRAHLEISPGARRSLRFSQVAYHGWYDFSLRGVAFAQRCAGREKNGRDGFSDPAI